MASPVLTRMRGTMLWFNESKDLGALRSEAGECVEVPGVAFAPGEKPLGRCAGKEVEFQTGEGCVRSVEFVPEPSSRRARRRHRR